MHHDLSVGLSPPHGHQQGLQGEVGGHARLRRPADHAARKQVDDDTQIQPALVGLDVGDVGHPDLIGRRGLEPLLQPVLRHDGWLAAVAPGTAFVANLCGDPGQRRQARHSVLGYLLALIAQIVRQLAIAVDLAAVGPGLPDQLGLTRILLCTVA
jgi:hypothetical protein